MVMRLCSTPSPAHWICWSTTKSWFVGPMKLHLVPQHPFVAMSASTPSMSCKPTRAATWTSWSITANTSGPANFDCLLAGTPSPNVK
jgi:hypothetical protein